jgi:DNA replicative helicase MCM subunit Mcm2 (Cdc46/Mcm family)
LDVVPELSEKLGTESSMVLMLMDEAVAEAQKTLMTTSVGSEEDAFSSTQDPLGGPSAASGGFGLHRREWCFKPRVHVRLSHLPGVPEYNKPNVSSIRATDIGRFVQVPGTVIRAAGSRVLEAERQYQCTAARCGFVFTVRSTVEANHTAELPTVCQAPGGSCKGKSFKVVEGSVVRTDYQEIKIQEQVRNVGAWQRVLPARRADVCEFASCLVLP